ncbi:MAG: bestrophin family ion channel [Cyanobacteria bacterium J06638_20]
MLLSKHRPWFRNAFRLRGSVIPTILPRTLICGLFGVLISILYGQGMPVYIPVLVSLIPNVVLGLMLVFRTNTAYERFWEGRKLWGSLINSTRNLARQIWGIIQETEPGDRQDKKEALYLIAAFAVAMKLHLREQPVNEEVAALVSHSCYEKLQTMNNPPLEIAFWIGDFLQHQFHQGHVNIYQLDGMQKLLNNLVDYLGGCERILKTPIPRAYAIHLKQLLLLYCFTLPFQLVQDLGYWTGAMVFLISFVLFGIEEIGLEIENPFGCDENDLPLNAICNTIKTNINDLMTLEARTVKDRTYIQDWPIKEEMS